MAVELANKKIDSGIDLLQRISKLNDRSINGASKLRRRVQAEIKCLTKVRMGVTCYSVMI